jgi:hypothetical protein
MTPTPEYRRLPGVKRNPFRKASLWIAGDHILSVNSYRFTEEYRRYYLKDIQAIILRQTSGATAASRVLNVAVIVALGAIVILRRQSLGLAIPAALLLAGFLILRFRGPTCVCHVITAVSRDKLPSLYRLKTAEKALRILQPLIEQAQRDMVRVEQTP